MSSSCWHSCESFLLWYSCESYIQWQSFDESCSDAFAKGPCIDCLVRINLLGVLQFALVRGTFLVSSTCEAYLPWHCCENKLHWNSNEESWNEIFLWSSIKDHQRRSCKGSSNNTLVSMVTESIFWWYIQCRGGSATVALVNVPEVSSLERCFCCHSWWCRRCHLSDWLRIALISGRASVYSYTDSLHLALFLFIVSQLIATTAFVL